MSDDVTLAALAERVAALEDRLDQEAGLRASQDRDLSSLAAAQRAGTHLIQAVSITQSDHTRALEEHTAALARLEAGQDQLATSLAQLTAGQAQIVRMLTQLIDRDSQD